MKTTKRFGLQIEGALAGCWVEELEFTWRMARAALRGRSLWADLTGTTRVDTAGQYLLKLMHKDGAQFLASGPAMQALISEIISRNVSDERQHRKLALIKDLERTSCRHSTTTHRAHHVVEVRCVDFLFLARREGVRQPEISIRTNTGPIPRLKRLGNAPVRWRPGTKLAERDAGLCIRTVPRRRIRPTFV
jgi:hypothetical protein